MKDRVLILLLVVFTFLSIIFYNFVDTIVVRKGYVESIRNGYITIIDNFGEVWKSGIENENLYSGQKVKMIMNNNHTEDEIKDDIIMKIIVDN